MANYKSSHRTGYYGGNRAGKTETARSQGAAFRSGADEPAARPYPAKPAVKVEGNAELWLTLQKVTDAKSGWVKTTRATAVTGGVILNTCSRKKGSAVVAEALVFIPGAKLLKTGEGVVLA